MTLRQAIRKLSALGFQMDVMSGCVQGKIGAEAFNYYPHGILSEPYRDVFIGKTKNGWTVSSHINFKGIRFRAPLPHQATILNISGSGETLEAAVKEFEQHFTDKLYTRYDTIALEGVPVPKEKGRGVPKPRVRK